MANWIDEEFDTSIFDRPADAEFPVTSLPKTPADDEDIIEMEQALATSQAQYDELETKLLDDLAYLRGLADGSIAPAA